LEEAAAFEEATAFEEAAAFEEARESAWNVTVTAEEEEVKGGRRREEGETWKEGERWTAKVTAKVRRTGVEERLERGREADVRWTLEGVEG